ncbi:MAG: lipid-A-disaccharide synthase [Sneathiella sp.]
MECRIKVFLVAGEPSGDALAARLMASLQRITGNGVDFSGVGGPLMEDQGLTSLFPMEELTIMGVAEVVPKIPALLKRIKETAQAAIDQKPDLFITVDAPDFSFRVAKRIKSVSFPKVHYVAPSVWAWRPGRAKKIATLYDHLLTILPFEPPYFEKEGLASTFVGHSVVESGASDGNGVVFRKHHKIASERPILMMLPGSRRSEVNRHLPLFRSAIDIVHKFFPDLLLVVPVIGKSAFTVEQALSQWPVESITIDGLDKYDAMAAADVALAASGTVGLELALAELPAVIAYKMHPVTGWLARKLVKLDYVNLVNILEDQEVVPEHLLEECIPARLAGSVIDLFESNPVRLKQIEGYKSAVSKLVVGEKAPGERAAEVVLSLVSPSGEVPE